MPNPLPTLTLTPRRMLAICIEIQKVAGMYTPNAYISPFLQYMLNLKNQGWAWNSNAIDDVDE